jgi:hypothetical protein
MEETVGIIGEIKQLELAENYKSMEIMFVGVCV